MDAAPVVRPILRRLVLARGANGHTCLLPVEENKAKEYVRQVIWLDFLCPCGVAFDAACELLSWTTEYEKRCLEAFKPLVDNRRTT